jgi:hypothetical protein
MVVTKEEQYLGFCVKCKKQQKVLNASLLTMKNGMRYVKGNCTKCNTKVCKILGKAK